jgi:hypothetical protein
MVQVGHLRVEVGLVNLRIHRDRPEMVVVQAQVVVVLAITLHNIQRL